MIKSNEMLPRERVLAILNHKKADICAAITPTSVVTNECIRAIGVSAPGIHTTSSDMAALAATAYTVLGFDTVMPYFSVHLEAEMLGCEIDWKSANMPIILKHPIKDPEEFSRPKNLLAKPLSRQLISAIKQLKSKLGNKVAIIGKVMGPWSLMYNLYGVGNLLIDTVIEPEKIKAFIHELLPIPIEFANAQFEAGADIVTWADHVTADTISPQIYEEFILPAHIEANKRFSSDQKIILHTCGNVMDRLHLIKKSGFEVFHLDSRNNLAKAAEIAGNDLILTGAINNPMTLLSGNKTQIKNEVKHNISAGISLVAPECAIPFNVSNQSLVTLVKTVHSYRYYDRSKH